MTVTNWSAVLLNGSITCTWDATEEYSFLYQDAEAIFLAPSGVTTWSGPWVAGAVYQAVDSATASPTPDPTELVPPRYITITWDEDPTAVKYEVNEDGSLKFYTAGAGTYSHKSNRLESGERTFGVIAIDLAGNRSEIKNLTYEIESPPPPVRSMGLTQSGAGNITLTITEPDGWPT